MHLVCYSLQKLSNVAPCVINVYHMLGMGRAIINSIMEGRRWGMLGVESRELGAGSRELGAREQEAGEGAGSRNLTCFISLNTPLRLWQPG